MPVTDTSTVTTTHLAKRIGKDAAAQSDEMKHAFDTAKALLADVLEEEARRQPPAVILDEAVLRAGRVVWDSKKSAVGGGQAPGLSDVPNRAPMDPRKTIRIVLAGYLRFGIA